ncbi:MAG: MFS transporter [Acidobacteria bacterium]|nr:MFS transporter [Acidobacteriota bacterium]
MTEHSGRWRALALIAFVELACMSLWFGVSSVTPALRAELGFSDAVVSWLTIAVQLGFVAGTLLSAILSLSDVISTRRLLWSSAILGAVTNALFALGPAEPSIALTLRFLTGMFLAGIYPPGMKLMATWFRSGRGLALGVLVGALTLGKASPYLVNAIGAEWRTTVIAASVSSVVGALVILGLVREGPLSVGTAPFDPKQFVTILRNRGVRLANFGYFGHMWELYAMWTWLPVMLRESFERSGSPRSLAEIGSFLVIGSGAAGCVVAGLIADRVGRTVVTSVAMVISGACCLIVGFLFGGSPVLLLILATIWGATIVADSAQFSACVTELGDPRYIGTALTLQTCIGFLLTTISIALVPVLVDLVGWRWAFAFLMPGPLLGTISMLRLRRLPEARQLAGGRG